MTPNPENPAPVPASKPGWRSYSSIVTAVLLISASLNFVLAWRLHGLRTHAAPRPPVVPLIKTLAPAIEAKDAAGRQVEINFSGNERPTVLYVFRPDCGWCMRNRQNVLALISQLGDRYRIIGLQLSSPDPKANAVHPDLGVPVYTDLSDQSISAYKLGLTPQTLVVASGGVIEKNWIGAYLPNLAEEVEAFFHVRLPGLAEQFDRPPTETACGN